MAPASTFAQSERLDINFLPETTATFWSQTHQPAGLGMVVASRPVKRLLIGTSKYGGNPMAVAMLTKITACGQRMPQVVRGDAPASCCLPARILRRP